MKRPLLLDLFCGAGGAAMGYYRAGFDIVGVDIKRQKRYPFDFVQGDALMPPVDLSQFHVFHASPPCQEYSVLKKPTEKSYPDLVQPCRQMLIASGRPYVIENVVGAPLINPVILCGNSFNLRTYRHRLFESNYPLSQPRHERHVEPTCARGYQGHNWQGFVTVCGGQNVPKRLSEIAMGIDWMSRNELSQAIPPAYTEYIGRQLIQHLQGASATA